MKQFASAEEFLCKLAERTTVYAPQKTQSGAAYLPWTEGSRLSDATNTVRSAKDFFFPQTENLVDFQMRGSEIRVIDVQDDPAPFVLFGVRGCDARSFELLDRVFLQEPVDACYARRRAAATIITLACDHPQETCFCTNFGIDPAAPGGDITAWCVDGALYLRENTEKGAALLASLDGAEECAEEAVKAAQQRTREILERLPLRSLQWKGFSEQEMVAQFHAPIWEELAQSCLGCGTCTFVCPTCQCYDIRDFSAGDTIRRFRCWDSCMYSDFTKMASGNPRLTQTERFRQRFLHKLCYFPENNEGLYGCVGCGRCLAKCPMSLHIVKVAKALEGEKHAD